MRKLSLIAILATTVLLLSATAAFANFGPHGGYAQDTDACAGCHRAHTSFSEVTWTDASDNTTQRSALLVSNASTMSQFCYACHGDAAPGAGTNVQSGVFDSGPTTEENAVPAGALMYSSNSSYDATLNGGGFDRIGGAAGKPVLSTHGMDVNANGTVWGDIVDGNGTPGTIANFRCTSCHDPHGSSNYRLLKDVVNGRTVGGYDKVTPDPYVISNEEGYPQGGWKRGTAGVGQMANYRPNYTTPEYAQLAGRSMSKWCAACHTAYIIENDANAPVTADGTDAAVGKRWSYSAAGGQNYEYPAADGSGESLYNTDHTFSGNGVGAAARHRHPIDVSMAIGQQEDGLRALTVKTVDDSGLPLEMPYSDAKTAPGSYADYHAGVTKPWDPTGNITCLTCHRAHGTEAAMSGWARSELSNTARRGPQLAPAREGVNPNFSEALLRYDNRGVCERCHDK